MRGDTAASGTVEFKSTRDGSACCGSSMRTTFWPICSDRRLVRDVAHQEYTDEYKSSAVEWSTNGDLLRKRYARMPRGTDTASPTISTGATKRTGPNGQAVGPRIHAHARTDALGRSRTFNLQIKSLLLCQLSYECKYWNVVELRGWW